MAHREAMLKYSATQQPSVCAQLNSQAQEDQLQHRQMLLKQLTSLRYLLRQGIAVRGHVEEEGNLHQLQKFRAEDIVGLERWLSDRAYQSHDIVNELIQLMAHQLLRHLLREVRQAEWYSVIADETRDASGAEQLGISLRWVDSDYTMYEDLIGLVEVEMTDAATLVEVIKDTLVRMNLHLAQCCGQAYDGASNMTGHLSGVSTRILSEEPRAHYVHCMAHCLNLCLQDCGRKCQRVRDALDIASELANLIRASPKRLALFTRLKDELAPSAPGLKPLYPTRWTVRTQAFDAILKNYTVICKALDEISTQSNTEAPGKPQACLHLWRNLQPSLDWSWPFLCSVQQSNFPEHCRVLTSMLRRPQGLHLKLYNFLRGRDLMHHRSCFSTTALLKQQKISQKRLLFLGSGRSLEDLMMEHQATDSLDQMNTSVNSTLKRWICS